MVARQQRTCAEREKTMSDPASLEGLSSLLSRLSLASNIPTRLRLKKKERGRPCFYLLHEGKKIEEIVLEMNEQMGTQNHIPVDSAGTQYTKPEHFRPDDIVYLVPVQEEEEEYEDRYALYSSDKEVVSGLYLHEAKKYVEDHPNKILELRRISHVLKSTESLKKVCTLNSKGCPSVTRHAPPQLPHNRSPFYD